MKICFKPFRGGGALVASHIQTFIYKKIPVQKLRLNVENTASTIKIHH